MTRRCVRCNDPIEGKDARYCLTCFREVSELIAQDQQRHRERFSRGKSLDSGAAA